MDLRRHHRPHPARRRRVPLRHRYSPPTAAAAATAAAATAAAVTDARHRAAHHSAAPPATALSARAATPNHCASRLAGETTYALVLFGLILPQMFAQLTFIQDSVANDVKYQGAAQPFLVFGILTTALAVGHHTMRRTNRYNWLAWCSLGFTAGVLVRSC